MVIDATERFWALPSGERELAVGNGRRLINPKNHLNYYSRVYRDAWRQVDQFRQGRGKDLPFWPEWCFLPLAGAFAIVSTEAESQGIDITIPSGRLLINDVGIISALAAWRVTQGVYRFDPDIFQAVIDTPINGDLPHDVLFNLPEWCIYIETPGLDAFGREMTGFFAHLEYDANDNRKELRLALDLTTPKDSTPRLVSQVIHLGPWSLLESVKKALREAKRVSMDLFDAETVPPNLAEVIDDNLMPLVSLLLYICSVNGEIGDGKRRPSRPKPVKTKKGPRLFPPNKWARPSGRRGKYPVPERQKAQRENNALRLDRTSDAPTGMVTGLVPGTGNKNML